MLPIQGGTELAVLALLCLLCGLIAIALRRFRSTLRDERARRVDAEETLTRTTALESLSRALSKAQTPTEVTHACLSELLAAAGAAAGAVAVVSDDGKELTVVQAMGYADTEASTPYSVDVSAKTLF